MLRYIASIFDHSGVYGGTHTSPVEQIIQTEFEAQTDEEAFGYICGKLIERTFDRNRGLIINPTDGKVVQRLESLMQETRVVDCSGYKLRKDLQRDFTGKVFARRVSQRILLGKF